MSEETKPIRSPAKVKLDKRRIDVTQVFLVYCALVGDVEQTATALDLDPEIVRQLSKEENWNQKLQRAMPSLKAQDEPIIVNRAINLIQAHRLRCLLESTIQAFKGKTPAEILAVLQTVTKSGKPTISGRFFADLSAAMEKAHHLTYAALGDTPPERKTAEQRESAQLDAAALHRAVISALTDGSCPEPAEVLVKRLAAEVESPLVVDNANSLSDNANALPDERPRIEPELPKSAGPAGPNA